MKRSIYIETRKLASGKTEVLLERQPSHGGDSKWHRECFEMTNSEDTELFVHHLERLINSG